MLNRMTHGLMSTLATNAVSNGKCGVEPLSFPFFVFFVFCF